MDCPGPCGRKDLLIWKDFYKDVDARWGVTKLCKRCHNKARRRKKT